jgi:hypothetical protein
MPTLSRRKRYIVFPEGSTFSVSLNVLKLDSVVLALKQTIPTEQPPLVGEVSTNFSG